MKRLIILFFILYSSSTFSCAIKNIPEYISKSLDIPTITKREIEIKFFTKNIQLAKYQEGCGIMGCNYFIFKQDNNNCYNLIGAYHGHLTLKNNKKNEYPIFELSFSSGDKMKIYYDFKQKKYTEE